MSWAHIAPEARERARQKLLAAWADPEYRERHVARLRTLRLGKTRPRLPKAERNTRAKVRKELWRARRDALGLQA